MISINYNNFSCLATTFSTDFGDNLSLSLNVLPVTVPFCASFVHYLLPFLPFVYLLVVEIRLSPGRCHFLFFLPRSLSFYRALGAPLP